jgi:hypothetical protein
LDRILTTASTLKYSSAIQQEFANELEEPSDDMIKLFALRVYDGHFTKRVRDEFRDIVANAFKESIREVVNRRLTLALEVTSERSATTMQDNIDDAGEEKVITTQDEIEDFHIVKSIVRRVAKADRIVMRDAKSYCAISSMTTTGNRLRGFISIDRRDIWECSLTRRRNGCRSERWRTSTITQSDSRRRCGSIALRHSIVQAHC